MHNLRSIVDVTHLMLSPVNHVSREDRATMRNAGTVVRTLLPSILVLTAILGSVSTPATADSRHGGFKTPLVIGHRGGATGYLPDHTLENYALGVELGADFIEPDLVMTRDGHLIARHEPNIKTTTDVASHPEFADRRTTKVIDGVTFADDWFTEDFTLAELNTLRAKERLPDVRQRNTIYDGRYTIPTFQEVIDLRDKLSRELHRRIGLIPELKHSTYFRSLGLPLEEPFVDALRANHLDNLRSKVTVQSFEIGNLQALHRQLRVPLVQLLDEPKLQPGDVLAAGGTTTYADMATPQGVRQIAAYADIVGPDKSYIVPRDPQTGGSLKPTSFVDDAHAAGLDVVPYTFRNENSFLPLELRSSSDPAQYGNAIAEYEQFFDLGVDGVFSDNPDTAKAARDDE
jgi:glycerophosphoryl diester phosphodiesterase